LAPERNAVFAARGAARWQPEAAWLSLNGMEATNGGWWPAWRAARARLARVGRVALWLAAVGGGLGAAAGCAGQGWPQSLTGGSSCSGDPCGALSCPSGFRCAVSQQCTARCEPEPTGRGGI
jgi:hypothetical protein